MDTTRTKGVSYISRCVNRTTHDDDFLYPEKRLWILRCSNRKVRQWSNRHNRNSVWFIFPQQVKHDFMRWFERRCKKTMFILDFLQLCRFLG